MGVGRGRRTGMVLILIIIIVLVVVLGVAYVLMIGSPSGVPGPDSDVPISEVTATPVPTTRDIIVAARDIPRGTRLSIGDVTTLPWPDTVGRPTGALEVGMSIDAAGLEQVERRIARVDILQGQPVLDHMLTPGDEPTELGEVGSNAALMIPSGQVAIAFPLSRVSGVAYALREGDHVDILVSFRIVDVDEDFQTILPNNIGLGIFPPDIESQTLAVRGREEEGPFGIRIMVVPSELTQRPRQVTQLLIDNVVILRVGTFPLGDVDQPIVVTQAPATPPPDEGTVDESGIEPTPVPQIVIVPDIVTLIMSRQDALVLKYALETGADIDFALRSVLDNSVADVTTDSVTLQYIIDFYNVANPPRLSIAPEPRIDLMAEQSGVFTPVQPISVTPPPASP